MLCKQDPHRSSNKLHDYGERAFGGGLRTREVPALHLGEQDYYLHQSCGLEILVLQERGQTTTYTMGVAPSRIRLGDQSQEGQRELSDRPLIASPCSKWRRHQRHIPRRASPCHLEPCPPVFTHHQLHRAWIDPGALESSSKR